MRVMPRFQRTNVEQKYRPSPWKSRDYSLRPRHVNYNRIIHRIQSTGRNKIFQRIELSIAWKVNYKFFLNTRIEKIDSKQSRYGFFESKTSPFFFILRAAVEKQLPNLHGNDSIGRRKRFREHDLSITGIVLGNTRNR